MSIDWFWEGGDVLEDGDETLDVGKVVVISGSFFPPTLRAPECPGGDFMGSALAAFSDKCLKR